MREFISGHTSGGAFDVEPNDRIVIYLVGPRGGTRCCEVLDTLQARTLRDNLDLALLKIRDAEVRREEAAQPAPAYDIGRPGSIDHMPERNGRRVRG
ncbi:hypothetical protein QA639_21275 [Bradyrhizobium pachyrhizi]|uniref:hypothetical protein n=1 Tax=Bradyrhizobium pachyrhizi TaxID=280333 RepID=UPI0024B11A9B|nr:hypothetical protein [Bradyrhizobium pachyrhizi]WFU52242.1 hypothetical protein QA639_21275 [Bradyrhizobium pachyrhizi]